MLAFIVEFCNVLACLSLLFLIVFGIMVSGTAHNSVSMAQKECKCPKSVKYTKTSFTTKLHPEGHIDDCEHKITFWDAYIKILSEIFCINNVESK